MAISFSEAIAQCAEHIAQHDSHGYSQPNRSGHGTESLRFSDGTPYAIHWGDYDCSEMVRTCVAAAGLVDQDYWKSYMWTGNEDEVLRGAGFKTVALSAKRRGDVLWKTGHTGIYLGNSLMADAHGDEYGGINGPTEGDQTGREIEIRSVSKCAWERCYRPPTGNVPAPEAAAPASAAKPKAIDIKNGIDISNWDSNLRGDETSAGFVIVKASEGTKFADKYAKGFLDAASKAGKLVGMYHFALNGNAEAEAEWFVACAKATGHLEDATLWLDYEADAVNNGSTWAERFMQRVDALTGKTCGVYMSQSVSVRQNWLASKHRPLWVAQYANNDPVYAWQDDPWSTKVYGAWGGTAAIHQYTDQGHVDGYGPLDLDRGYFTANQWAAWAAATVAADEPSKPTFTVEKPKNDETPAEGGKEGCDVQPTKFQFTALVNVRKGPGLSHPIVVGANGKYVQYAPGNAVVIDRIAVADGYVWGHYVGADSGEDRWVALGNTEYVAAV